MELLATLFKIVFGELLKMWNRPDGVISGPVPVLEDIELEDDIDARLLDQYGLLDPD